MKHILKTSLAAALLIVAGCTGDDEANAAPADDSSSEAADETTNDAVADASTPALFMGNDNCPASGNPIDAEFFVEHEGQKSYYCCGDCQTDAAADPAAAIAAAYPSATPVGNKACPISGDPVEDGNAVSWQGQEIGLCCGMCKKAFEEDPAKSVAAAIGE